jgi:hypothetical protein
MIFLGVLVLAAYTVAVLCLGARLLHMFRGPGAEEQLPAGHTALARLAVSFLLGVGVWANVLLLLSLTGSFTRPVVAGFLGACLLAGFRPAWRDLRGAVRQAGRAIAANARRSWAWKIVGLGALGLIVLYAFCTALPPKGDPVIFYLAWPKIVAHLGRAVVMPGFEFFTQIGLHGEMHFAALLSLGDPEGAGAQAATMFVFPVALAAAILLLEIGRRAGLGSLGRWILLVMLFTTSAFTRIIPGGNTNLFGAAHALAAVYWTLDIAGSRGGRAILLTGVFSGFAVIAKLSLLATLAPTIALLAIWRVFAQPDAPRRILRLVIAAVGVAACAAVVCAPHVIKNAVLFGEPLAPFVTSGPQWLQQEWFGEQDTQRLTWTYPLALVFGQYRGMYGVLTPLALAFLPLAVLLRPAKRWWRSPLAQVTVVSVLAVALWAVLRPGVFALRYFLPSLLTAMLLSARAAERACEYRRLRPAVVACLLLAMAATFNRSQAHPGLAVEYVLGRKGLGEVGDLNTRAALAVNALARPGERILAGTKYRYFLRADLLAGASGQADEDELLRLATPQRRWERAWRMGFRFLMLSPEAGCEVSADGEKFVLALDRMRFESETLPQEFELERIYLERKKDGPAWAAYRIRRREAEGKEEKQEGRRGTAEP